jgi:N-acyl homoserine lactone hydrolase
MIDQFWIFHCGWMRAPRAVFFDSPSYDLIHLPFMSAVAFHRDHGPILVDAPYGLEGPKNVGAMLDLLLRRGGMRFEEQWSIVPRLEQLGFRAADVSHILMTHLHYDHTGGMKTLCHADFHASMTEWDFAVSLPPRRARIKGYVPEDYRAIRPRMNLVEEVPLIGDDVQGVDVLGDGSIEMIALPGHTIGQVGYRFNMTDGRRIFHVGDAAFSLDQIKAGINFGFFPRKVAYDLEQAVSTLEALRAYHRANPDDVLVSSHDSALGEECLAGPVHLRASDR